MDTGWGRPPGMEPQGAMNATRFLSGTPGKNLVLD